MESILKAENLVRNFKSGNEIVRALKNVSLTIKESTLTILRGRSGSGKTTLINLLAALDYPDEGKVYFDNDDIIVISELKRDEIRRLNMGIVFQSVALISQMTAYENVEFGLRIAGYDKKNRKQRAEECLRMVGLQKRMHHLPHELSGGEQQRVAIARAIAHKPKIVFADEPTAELDTNTGIQIVKIFRHLVQNEGLSIVMTTHDPGFLDAADQVITLEDGEVVNE